MNEYGELVHWCWRGRTEVFRARPLHVSLNLPQIPHNMGSVLPSSVRGRRLLQTWQGQRLFILRRRAIERRICDWPKHWHCGSVLTGNGHRPYGESEKRNRTALYDSFAWILGFLHREPCCQSRLGDSFLQNFTWLFQSVSNINKSAKMVSSMYSIFYHLSALYTNVGQWINR